MRRFAPRPAILGLALVAALTACSEPAPPPATVDVPPPPIAGATSVADSTDVHRFRIDTLEAAVLRDGDIAIRNDGRTLGVGAPRDELDAVLTKAGEPTDTIRLAVQVLLVRSGDRGAAFRRRRRRRRLRRRGPPAHVTACGRPGA